MRVDVAEASAPWGTWDRMTFLYKLLWLPIDVQNSPCPTSPGVHYHHCHPQSYPSTPHPCHLALPLWAVALPTSLCALVETSSLPGQGRRAALCTSVPRVGPGRALTLQRRAR